MTRPALTLALLVLAACKQGDVAVDKFNTDPTARITAPADRSAFDEGETVVFTGVVGDEQDDPATLVVTWSSDLDPSFVPTSTPDGEGNVELATSQLISGNHTIGLHVADSAGTTADAYVTNGIMTRNEVRRQENLNHLDGLDEPLTPLNMERTGAPPPAGDPPPDSPRRQAPPVEPDEDDARAAATPPPAVATPPPVPRRLTLIAEAAAARVVRKEVEQLRANAEKLRMKAAQWGEWLFAFYEKHAAFVADAMQLEPALARDYCKTNRDQIAGDGCIPDAAIATIEDTAARRLVAYALEHPQEPAHV